MVFGQHLQAHAGAITVETADEAQAAAVAVGLLEARRHRRIQLRERYAEAYRNREKLRFVGRLQAGGLATVGLESLPAEHPLVGGAGTDNRVAVWSDRYRERPLVIQGPGAGAEVTAAGLLDDALAIQAEDAAWAQSGSTRPKNASIG